MSKIRLNAIVDILGFIAFIFSAFSGIVLLWVLQGGKSNFLGLIKHNWTDVHNISSIIFVILIVIHIILHWNFIKNISKYLKF